MILENELLKKENIEFREYQVKIAENCKEKNSLIVLPTGLGKTIIAILIAAYRLKKYENSKILVLAPTRPLCAQQHKIFKENLKIEENKFALITGKVNKEKRKLLYERATVIVSTPQTIENDIKNNLIDLSNFSLLVIDEAHRSVGNYSYTFISKYYSQKSKFPLIIGLTASPSDKLEKIEEIKNALSIENAEIRTEKDPDVRPYVKKIFKEYFYVELNEKFKEAVKILAECLSENLNYLKEKKVIDSLEERISKKYLIEKKKEIEEEYLQSPFKDYNLMWKLIKISEAIKILHAIEILETEGSSIFLSYVDSLFKSNSKLDRNLVKDPRIRRAYEIVKYESNNLEHPKFYKLLEIVKSEIANKSDVRIIIFANYRDSVLKINEFLKNNGVKSEILIGQAMKKGIGLKQEKQIEILKKFENKEFNCLVCSSIGEEGLDFTSDLAIFYDQAPSAVRSIQRRGRVGRKTSGKVIYLITKSTLDEIFYWSSYAKEKKMRNIIWKMKKEGSLKDYVN